jgi:hypothetical protein
MRILPATPSLQTNMRARRKATGKTAGLRVKAGSKPEDSGVSVDCDVTRHFRVESGIDAKGGSSLGVGAEWDCKWAANGRSHGRPSTELSWIPRAQSQY